MAGNTSAHTEVPGGHDGGGHGGSFPPFNSSTYASQLVWLALTFILLYVLMARVALPRIAAIFSARQARIADDLADAARFKGDADAAIAAYEKELAEARGRAQVMASETREKLFAETEVARHAVEDRLATKLAEAERAIMATKSAAMANVRGIAVDAAAAIVHRLTGVAVPETTAAQAVDAVLKR
jgi:F-type H+-transporting ATPase subunit b